MPYRRGTLRLLPCVEHACHVLEERWRNRDPWPGLCRLDRHVGRDDEDNQMGDFVQEVGEGGGVGRVEAAGAGGRGRGVGVRGVVVSVLRHILSIRSRMF